MKFDYCIGNPPYQEKSDTSSDNPLYHLFMDSAYSIADKVELITPAKFLSNAGKTPKAWNEKMLNDTHFKILSFSPKSEDYFSKSVDITGGVAIHYRDAHKEFGAIETFIPIQELNTIKEKVEGQMGEDISTIMYQQNRFSLENLYRDYPEVKQYISSNGNEQRIISGYFNQMDNIVFFEKPFEDSIAILGIINNNQRGYRYINAKYVQDNGILNKYKVLVPFANGSGALGEVVSTPIIGTPLIGTPLIGYTKSFIGVGSFSTKTEAERCLKYIKSKFARTLLGVLKITQNNAPKTWRYVPLQDFTAKSDIDWSQSIADIDKQLYKKYGLSKAEIEFIETNVKAMA